MGPPKRKKASAAPEPTFLCSPCGIHYPNYEAYAAHRKRKMDAGEGHIHCHCGMDFNLKETLIRHQKEQHAHDQDLSCPGCGLNFVRTGGLMHHIEADECVGIAKEEIAHAREQRTKLGRALAIENGADPKAYFGKFLGDGYSAAAPHQRFYGHIVESSGRKALEDSNLSVGAQSFQPKQICGPDLRPGNLDETEFPSLSEAAASSKKPGNQNQKAGLPAPGLTSSALLQLESGPDLRPGSLDKMEFPTLAEATSHKATNQKKHIVGVPSVSISGYKANEVSLLSGFKTLNDSRWAPKKKTAVASAHQINCLGHDLHLEDKSVGPKIHAKSDQAKNIGLLQETIEATASPLVQNQHLQSGDPAPSILGSGMKALEGSNLSVEAQNFQPKTTTTCGKGVHENSVKSVPPHLRAKLLRAASTESSQVSNFTVDDQPVQMIPPHLQAGFLSAGLAAAANDGSKDEDEDDALTIKQESDKGTMGMLPAKSSKASSALPPHPQAGLLSTGLADAEVSKGEDDAFTAATMGMPPAKSSRPSSALPPHLRGKVKSTGDNESANGVDEESSNGSVPLGRQEKQNHAVTVSAKATEAQFGGSPNMLTGQNSYSDLESTHPSRSREHDGTSHDNAGLPPHLRGRKPGNASSTKPGNASSTKPAEMNHSPTPSLSTGHSTPEPQQAPSEPGVVGPLPSSRDNFGVTKAVQSWATVANSGNTLPPHLRGEKKAPMPPRSVATQTQDVVDSLQNVSLKPTDTSINAISVSEKDSGLGRHDPEHPLYDPRIYRSPFQERYKCPLPLCGKLFPSMQGITGHLNSDIHKRPLAQLQCPHCLRMFGSTAALTQHSESQGRRCEIRNTGEFRPFIDQLTAGIADVDGMHDDQTNRYIVTTEAVTRYGGGEFQDWGRRAVEDQEKKQIDEKGGNMANGLMFSEDKGTVW